MVLSPQKGSQVTTSPFEGGKEIKEQKEWARENERERPSKRGVPSKANFVLKSLSEADC